MTPYKNCLRPPDLEKVWQNVLNTVEGVTLEHDRRGYKQLHWFSPNGKKFQKPYELSFEHEARLMPTSETTYFDFRTRMQKSITLTENELFPIGSPLRRLQIKRYNDRELGFQSVDRYYDDRDMNLTKQMLTVRERIKTSKFMTWSTSDITVRALNLELPFLSCGKNGITARLEFNWLENIMLSFEESYSGSSDNQRANPFRIAFDNAGIKIRKLTPVIEHTTFREKFGLYSPNEDSERFVINIDHVVAQSIETKQIGSYIDIDVSFVEIANENNLSELDQICNSLKTEFNIVPNLETKAYRDAIFVNLI